MAEITFVEVVETGPGWNKILASDGNVYTFKGDYNWRSNNPGNIEYGDFAKSMGAIGSGAVPKGRQRGFAIFPSYEAGERAREKLQFEGKSYKDKTIRQAISRYAPSFENDVGAYVRAVTSAAGVSADTKMSDLTPQQRRKFLDAQRRHEGFRPGKIMGAEGAPVPQSLIAQFKGTPLPSMNVPVVAPIPLDKPKNVRLAQAINSVFSDPQSSQPRPLQKPKRVQIAQAMNGVLASSPRQLPEPRPLTPNNPLDQPRAGVVPTRQMAALPAPAPLQFPPLPQKKAPVAGLTKVVPGRDLRDQSWGVGGANQAGTNQIARRPSIVADMYEQMGIEDPLGKPLKLNRFDSADVTEELDFDLLKQDYMRAKIAPKGNLRGGVPAFPGMPRQQMRQTVPLPRARPQGMSPVPIQRPRSPISILVAGGNRPMIGSSPSQGGAMVVNSNTNTGSTLESMGFSSGGVVPAATIRSLSERGYI